MSDTFSTLGQDIVLSILSELDIETISSISKTCRYGRKICTSTKFWKFKFSLDFPQGKSDSCKIIENRKSYQDIIKWYIIYFNSTLENEKEICFTTYFNLIAKYLALFDNGFPIWRRLSQAEESLHILRKTVFTLLLQRKNYIDRYFLSFPQRSTLTLESIDDKSNYCHIEDIIQAYFYRVLTEIRRTEEDFECVEMYESLITPFIQKTLLQLENDYDKISYKSRKYTIFYDNLV